MNLKQFITTSETFFDDFFILGFFAREYPLLFLKKVCDYLKATCSVSVLGLDLQNNDFSVVCSQLEMSFLGQKNIYWLGDLSAPPLKNYGKWVTYLSEYNGPHSILFFTSKAVAGRRIKLVSLPDEIDFSFFKQLTLLWPIEERERINYTMQRIFKKVGFLSLDQAVQMVEYALVLGSARPLFLEKWLLSIVKPESSLFNLSGALFARDRKGFLRQWCALQRDYEFPFWLTYFSEQFFRAYYYVHYKKMHKHVEAKNVGFRLPFSFLQKDWKKWEPTVLHEAHQRVTNLDFNLKNGGSAIILESLFLLFFK